MLILSEQPGGFFWGQTREEATLPLFSILPGMSLTVPEIIAIVLLIKAYSFGNRNHIFIRKSIFPLFIYLLFTVLYSFLIGISLENVVYLLRSYTMLSLMFTIPQLLYRRDDYESFFQLISPFVVIVLISQATTVIYGNQLVKMIFGTGNSLGRNINEASSIYQTDRPIEAVFLVYITIIMGLFFQINGSRIVNRVFNLIFITTSFIAIILTATRGWFVGVTVLGIGYLFSANKKAKMIISTSFIFLLGLVTISMLLPQGATIFSNSLLRLSTLTELASGDLTLGGTNIRATSRSESAIQRFLESPIIIGWGVSDKTYEYNDPHVGNQSLLLESGLVGFFLFLMFWAKSFLRGSEANKVNWIPQSKVASLRFLKFVIVSLIVIHSSSTMLFGFYLSNSKYLFLSIIFSFYYYFSSKEYLFVKAI